jgi:carboxyl-terminal processing protease
MHRFLRFTALGALLLFASVLSGHRAQAQQGSQTLTPGQQVVAHYLITQGSIPAGLQLAQITPLSNVIVAAFAEAPSEIQKVIDRSRIDGLEEDFSRAGTRGQIQLQISLFKDSAGASQDVDDPSLLAGLGASRVSAAPRIGDHSAAYSVKSANLDSNDIVFSAGRVEVLVSQIGRPGTVSMDDILPLAQLMESKTKLPPPPPGPDELAVLETQTSPENILYDAYGLLIENYLDKLTPSQLLAAAWKGAAKALSDAGVTSIPPAPNITSSDEDQAWSQFLTAYQDLEKLAPSSVSARDLAYAAADELYNNLNCHTTFFKPTDYAKEVSDLSGGQRARIGILVQKQPDSPYTILRVEPGSPAEQAGLLPGDQILAVDHQTPEASGDHFTELLTGAAGTPVTLTISRPGQSASFDITVIRQLISPTIVEHRLLPGGIGYIELDNFTDTPLAFTEVKKALDDFQSMGTVNDWIVDLRYNPGGSGDTLQRIAGLFLQPGSLVLTEIEQDGTITTSRAAGTPEPEQKSMVMLIGKDTASAAEIFAEAMRDLGRVTLVGDTTAGCVNGGLNLGLLDGSGVFVSTVKVQAGPNKVELENKGVTPDVSVPLSTEQIQSGRDPQLDAAVALFGNAPTTPAASAGASQAPVFDARQLEQPRSPLQLQPWRLALHP